MCNLHDKEGKCRSSEITVFVKLYKFRRQVSEIYLPQVKLKEFLQKQYLVWASGHHSPYIEFESHEGSFNCGLVKRVYIIMFT